ncbi:molybdenum cofactor cytidylyltransferase [Clostridium botulinum]|uniref:molybdenum cofactor cytidylyltransferase n=1 Tax=Clostridium botulinum TaxID=1491 RepID=UPI001A9331B9|nr:molybdenum cofactor cytidylyltransferase [Clostridium botulinum]MBO0524297.1 molybdenum cofactor cytidylyltransferase [Clostridium botulinum]MBO0529627.1 molybdenum cofactor cytidylyltransferase [Clostridium botulinum]MBO0530291.1 molybdenum cofactor cytidylyltransferase [Clostridium botulinum]MBO0534997.1 molybdenum cofactor cytidylyltransferase [Clostridium botulinum]MBO0538845.1 molybdenum cofactor cytidylyltransferase [Clostridium botulinum]
MVNAVIMASGYSTRMGKNKLMLPFKGKPIIEHVIDAIKECNFNEIILVGQEKEVLDIAKKKNILTILNTKAYKGQSQSIELGILNTSSSKGYMFFTGDQPLLDSYTINLLLNTFTRNNDYIIIPKYKNKVGSPTIFPEKFKNELLDLQGDVGGKTVINNHINEIIFVNLRNGCSLFDIDTPKDYEYILTKNLYQGCDSYDK